MSPAPAVSIWYRGTPAGTPTANDLASIRAMGFASVTWPQANTAGAAELRRLADIVGLAVVIRVDSVPLSAASALKPGDYVDVVTAGLPAGDIPALTWRAIAHGARVISFDGGAPSGAGLSDAGGALKPWVEPARAIARQLAFNGHLVTDLEPGGSIRLDGKAPDSLDLILLQDLRSWVLVATNTAHSVVRAVAHLPAGTPPALWSSLLDGTTMSMINQLEGPTWNLTLEPGVARVYVIDKKK
jgi:hypothetical protein